MSMVHMAVYHKEEKFIFIFTQKGFLFPNIPKSVTYNIDEQKKTLAQNSEEYDFGGDVIRLIQSSIVIDVNTAISIRDWLDDKIKTLVKEEEQINETE
jgi:hypothetical protein